MPPTTTTNTTILKTITHALSQTTQTITQTSSHTTPTSPTNPQKTPFHLFFLPKNQTTNYLPKNPFTSNNNNDNGNRSYDYQHSLFIYFAAFVLICVVVCTGLWLLYRREVNEHHETEASLEGRSLLDFARGGSGNVGNGNASVRGGNESEMRGEIRDPRRDVKMGESSRAATYKVNRFGVVEETREKMDIMEELRRECLRIMEERIQRGEMRVEEEEKGGFGGFELGAEEEEDGGWGVEF